MHRTTSAEAGGPGGRGLSWGRIVVVLRKEFVQLHRDRLTFAMLIGVPIMQLLLFGYAINADPRQLPTAVVVHDNSPLSGLMFPFRGMPPWAQTLGELLRLTHFPRIVRSIMLKGAGWSAQWPEAVAIGAFVLVMSSVAPRRYRQTLGAGPPGNSRAMSARVALSRSGAKCSTAAATSREATMPGWRSSPGRPPTSTASSIAAAACAISRLLPMPPGQDRRGMPKRWSVGMAERGLRTNSFRSRHHHATRAPCWPGPAGAPGQPAWLRAARTTSHRRA